MKDFLLTVTKDGALALPPEICDYCGASFRLSIVKTSTTAMPVEK